MVDSFYWAILGCVTTVGIIGSFALMNAPSHEIPPTNAFSEIYINGLPVKADVFNDKLYITTEGIITTTIQGKSVNMKVQQPAMTCPILEAVVGFDADGNPICGVI